MYGEQRGERRALDDLRDDLSGARRIVVRWALRAVAVAAVVAVIALGIIGFNAFFTAHPPSPATTYNAEADPLQRLPNGEWTEHVTIHIRNDSGETADPVLYVSRSNSSVGSLRLWSGGVHVDSVSGSAPCTLDTVGEKITCSVRPHSVSTLVLTYDVGPTPGVAQLDWSDFHSPTSGPTWQESQPRAVAPSAAGGTVMAF